MTQAKMKMCFYANALIKQLYSKFVLDLIATKCPSGKFVLNFIKSPNIIDICSFEKSLPLLNYKFFQNRKLDLKIHILQYI